MAWHGMKTVDELPPSLQQSVRTETETEQNKTKRHDDYIPEYDTINVITPLVIFYV